jgi:hypothetical protein
MMAENNTKKTQDCGSCKSKPKADLRCGSCSGLNREKLISGAGTFCEGQGKLKTSKACNQYRPDVFALSWKPSHQKVDSLNMLAMAMTDFTPNELQIVAALFLREKKTRQVGFKFWQKVYIRIKGSATENYMDNFVTGRVLDADKEYIRIISETGKTCIQAVYDLNSSTVYTIERFRPIRSKMLKDGKLIAPQSRKRVDSVYLESLDFAFDTGMLEKDFAKRNRKIKKVAQDDLVSIIQKMASGKILKRRKRENMDNSEISINHY